MSKLLDPKVLMAIKDLSLAAKTVIDGFMTGINKSSIKGPGLEFSQYRSYQPGDDLRWLDWKMYGRSDRYYIRESEVETSISVRFLIDASGSMNHEDRGVKKIDYARYLAASLAYLANLQGDAIGLYVFNEDGLFSLAARQDFQHLSRMFHQLEGIKAGGKFTKAINYKDIYSGSRKRELLVFISDLYEQNGEIFNLLDTLSALKNEVIVFHLMGKNEMDLDYKGYTAVEDLETGETLKIDANTSKKGYQENLEKHLSQLRMEMLDRQISYRLISMDQPLDQALRDFLNQRNKLRS
ncbi:DUF58 domain-containing protein [Daejeonella sp. H1SJ63]|uniref:DUF58 domain-containing protein n=1 Tax=Daejeonella sp. H1SJ63 TaxID=3034145 RepID=UPI0023ED3D4C|nr:DUF58 domain-containing protein [Daejeonella sp. H1SJ63]